jgi:hypothetical protein
LHRYGTCLADLFTKYPLRALCSLCSMTCTIP